MHDGQHFYARFLAIIMWVTKLSAYRKLRKMKFFDYNLTTDIHSINLIDRNVLTPIVVNCLNPHSFVTAEVDACFKESLLSSTYLLPDGIGVCMALKRYKGIRIDKIAGEDFHYELLSQLNEKGGKLLYMGSNNVVLGLIEDRIHREYPNIIVKTHSPSYCEDFSTIENKELVSIVNEFAPDALLVGMTAPKQEKWLAKWQKKLQVKLFMGIGGSFDVLAGNSWIGSRSRES